LDEYDAPSKGIKRSPSPDTLARRLDRAERKRRRAARGDSDDDERAARKARRREEKRREKLLASGTAGSSGAATDGIFEVEYVKKGGVREWDVGK